MDYDQGEVSTSLMHAGLLPPYRLAALPEKRMRKPHSPLVIIMIIQLSVIIIIIIIIILLVILTLRAYLRNVAQRGLCLAQG